MENKQNKKIDKENEIHLIDYWNIINLRLPVFVIVFVLVISLAVLYIILKTPVYRAETKLVIEPTAVNISDIEGVYDPESTIRDFQGRQEYLSTQMQIMLSEGLLSKVYADLHFDKMKEFQDAKDPLKSFKKLFDVSLTRKTFLITVAFDWKDPKLAAEASRYLTRLYVENYEKRSVGFSDQGLQNLKVQLKDLEKDRNKALKDLVTFKRKNRMIDLDDAKELLVTRMVKMNEALIKAEVEEIKTQSAYESVKKAKSIEEAAKKYPEIFDNPTITQFKLERLKNKIEELGLLKEYNEMHKKVINQKQIIKYIEGAVNEEVAIAIASVGVLYERAKLLRILLARGLDDLKNESFKLDELASEFRILKDNYDAKDKSYKYIINRINEITITQASGKVDATGNIHVVTQAKTPTEIYSPKKIRILAIAFILGLLLAGGTCFGLDYIDRTVKYKEEVEQATEAPILGFLPKVPHGNADIAALKDQGGQIAESFGSIRTNLGLSILGRSMQCCLVTSVVPQEGKTLVSFNMALSFARAGYKVLLMECDMRKPRLKKLLADVLSDEIPEDGLSSVIVGLTKMSDAIVSVDGTENLDVALCGHIPPNPSELLGSENFNEVLQEAKKQYDMVIIDTPPSLHVTDSVILAGSGIPVVLVARVFHTGKKQLEIAVEQIKNAQGKIVGTVINNIEKNASKNLGYYYGGYYHDYREDR